jgi:hypothetical protein
MLRGRKSVFVVLIVTALLAEGAAVGIALAAQKADQRITHTDKVGAIAQGEAIAKELLLLMDKDKNGKVSKQEFMNFMEAEFNRLDKDKSGELDVQELTQSQFQVRAHPAIGK